MTYSLARWEQDALDNGPAADDSDLTTDQIASQESAEAEDYEMDKWMDETEEYNER